MAQSENVAAIERAVEHMNSGNLDGYLEMYAEDLTLHGYPPGVEGKEGVSAFYGAFAKALPDVELTLDDAVSDGDKVAVRYTIKGTHSDELMGVPATGNRVDVSGQSFFRFEDGRVVERWQSLDAVTLLTQIGALPAPA
jgi:steroid delta-isomerase-like uncharacterized protein